MEMITNHTTTLGGIMTREVGAISGDVSIKTVVDDDMVLTASIAYAETDEWYQVVGGSILLGVPRYGELPADEFLHAYVVAALLTDNGVDDDENPLVNDLKAVKQKLG